MNVVFIDVRPEAAAATVGPRPVAVLLVVLGLHPEPTPGAAIGFAFLETRERGTALEVVSASTARRIAAAEAAQRHRLNAFGNYRDVKVEAEAEAAAVDAPHRHAYRTPGRSS